ncbi:hypothetical protein [Raoultibacter timonensis]|nr:hypothetical protein [Raoultibacter timonensis]
MGGFLLFAAARLAGGCFSDEAAARPGCAPPATIAASLPSI